jgi:hypothetical protein
MIDSAKLTPEWLAGFFDGGSGHRLPQETRDEREFMRLQMRRLNYVGPFKPNVSDFPEVVETKGFIV